MTDINDLLSSPQDRSTQAGGFTGFVIGTFEAIQGLTFIATWIVGAVPWLLGGLLLSQRSGDADVLALLALLLGIVFGFLFAVWITGFAEVFLDMRRQLIAIRKQLEAREGKTP